MLALDGVRDPEGNTIQEPPLPIWANFYQRALKPVIAEINAKTDLEIAIESMERKKYRRVTSLTFAIKTQALKNGDSSPGAKS